jgi:hypothetical protein
LAVFASPVPTLEVGVDVRELGDGLLLDLRAKPTEGELGGVQVKGTHDLGLGAEQLAEAGIEGDAEGIAREMIEAQEPRALHGQDDDEGNPERDGGGCAATRRRCGARKAKAM